MAEIVLNERDVIGVELFMIRNGGMTKKKPKFRCLEAYAKHKEMLIEVTDEYERALYICYYIQQDFQAFRAWFKTYES